MSAVEFQSSKFFDNILVSTMKYMENFAEKTRDDKSQFMKGLLRVLPQFPERVLLRKILPCLMDELKDHALLPYTLPNVFFIIQKMTPKEFEERVLPQLKPIFLVREPMQNLLTLLEKIELLHQKASSTVFKEDIMPLVYVALEPKNPPSVQEKALKTVPGIMEALDYTTVKSSLFPRIATLFAQTTTLTVKVSTLLCFQTIMKILDKFTITEKVIPLLRNIKTREITVTMATLQVYEEMGKHVEKEIIGNNIIPHLWNLALGPNLKAEQDDDTHTARIQFERFMSTIQELSTKVHQQHLRHLQDLKKLEDQTKSFTASSDPATVTNGTGSTLTDFEKLVQGGAGSSSGSATPSSTRQSSSDNPFRITSDNPFAGNNSQDSPLDMFGDMASSLPPMTTRPMSLTPTPAIKPMSPTMFGATSAEPTGVAGFGSRPITPTSNSSFQQNSGFGKSATSGISGSVSTAATTSFSIPPLDKPPSSNSSFSSPTRLPFSQPQQKPAGSLPLSHTLGGIGGQQSGNSGVGLGMGMTSTPTLTPSRPVSGMNIMPLAPMTPLQPTNVGGMGNKTGQNNTGHKGKNSDLGMFDPFS
ncbi:hypothetical protein BGX31_009331 [Mortierella sp. GBA43]|nr:hypothetical protein BGX31_009331 [Mortierella sp. GBA43]